MTRDKDINARPDGSINTRRATPDEIAYRDGYTQGQTNDQAVQSAYRRVEYENQRIREDNSAANGIVMGLVLASLVGAIAGIFYFLSQNPTVTPAPAAPQAQPVTPQPPVIERQTTVIERTVDRVREVEPPTVPEVEVNVPTPEVPVVEPVQPEAVQPEAPEAPTAPEEPAQ